MEVNIIIWEIFQQVCSMTLMCIFRAGQGLDWPRCAPGSAKSWAFLRVSAHVGSAKKNIQDIDRIIFIYL